MYRVIHIPAIVFFIYTVYLLKELKDTTKTADVEDLNKAICKLSNNIQKLEEKNVEKDESAMLYLKINVAVRELNVINGLINQKGQDYEETTNFDCGCGFPKFFGKFGPLDVKIKYTGVKTKKQIIDEKLQAVDDYIKDLKAQYQLISKNLESEVDESAAKDETSDIETSINTVEKNDEKADKQLNKRAQ
ncbi:hypothetical protein BDAP_002535 [Binucleata daphniae]